MGLLSRTDVREENFRNAHYVLCYAQQFNNLFEQAASNIIRVRIFFANLNGITAFIFQSPNRRATLEYEFNKRYLDARNLSGIFNPGQFKEFSSAKTIFLIVSKFSLNFPV